MNNRKLKKIKLLSLFTGGGFLDIGFSQAGFDIVWTNENNELFAELYANGMNTVFNKNGSKHSFEISDKRSIVEIDSKEIVNNAFGKKYPEIFGIIGGPPCQDFSIAGKVKGFQGKRGKLTEEFFNKIIEIEPTFFLMENVESLWKIKKQRRAFVKILKPVTEKYSIVKNILNAIEYGVPQNRNRLFVVGINRKYIKNIEFELMNNFYWPEKKFDNAVKKFSWPKIDEYKGSPKQPKDIPRQLYVDSYLVPEKKNNVKNCDEIFKTYSEKFNTIEEGDTNRQSFKRLHRYRYSPTACYGNNEVHLHPYLPRRLSVREALRIQGVPDTYELPSIIGGGKRHLGLSAKFKMISNGVPIPLAKTIAMALREFLFKNL